MPHLTRAQKVSLVIAALGLLAAILGVFTPILDLILRDKGDSETSADVARACNTLIADLRGEAAAVEALRGHLRAEDGHVVAKDDGFDVA